MNGLAGFREPVEGTYATCCGIGASPAAVFRHLVRLADGSSAWAFLEDVRVLSAPSADANGLVRCLRCRLRMRSCCCPGRL